MKYHLITLGCQMNISDSERVRTVFDEMGFSLTDKEEEAGLLGIIACSVRQKAIDKVYSRIAKWNKWKNNKNLITFVTGCILPADQEKFLKLFDLVFPVSDVEQMPQMLRQYGVSSAFSQVNEHETLAKSTNEATIKPEAGPAPVLIKKGKLIPQKNDHIFKFWSVKPQYESKFEAFIPIQNGCDKFCTFCAVPYTRGREVSRPSEEILDELRELVDAGYKSITLLGQNVNSYGLDKKGAELNFPQLMDEIGKIGLQSGKKFWVYFTSPHPRDMSRELIDVIAKYDCLAKQLHLPLQSGNDSMLIKMNRNHSFDKYKGITDYIKAKLPTATIFTDIIVGFTGETEEYFRDTVKAFEDIRFDMAYIAQYSPRQGAASSRWNDDVSKQDKKDRYHKLTRVLQQILLEKNQEMIGKLFTVLVRGKDRKERYLSALTEGKTIVRFESEDESLIGNFVEVEIRSVEAFSAEGELVKVLV